MDILTALESECLLFDGAMGTMLQENGLPIGGLPELFNLTYPQIVTKIHRAYVEAGSDIVTTNTFQANSLKLPNEHKIEEVIVAGISLAKASGARFVALDVGPLGQLLAPMGTLQFEEAYDLFKEQVVIGEKAGADCILFETFTDLYEIKIAILAAKENTSLPIFCTLSYQADGRTFVGCDPMTATLTLQALGADVIGVNCSLGPKELIPIVDTILTYAQVPVLVQANAGLPEMEDGQTVYRLDSETYGHNVNELLEMGVTSVGGCCGTTPDYIKTLKRLTHQRTPNKRSVNKVTALTSGTQTVCLDNRVSIIGERINPTGKEKLKEALRSNRMDFLIKEAIFQQEAGADILDVNVGLPELDEAAVMKKAIQSIQSVVQMPLQIDSVKKEAIEAGVRIYNGRPLINSVNGNPESMAAIFPIAKKYGALVLGLTLADEIGIPQTAGERLAIARRIVTTAKENGLSKEDILIDPLVLTASAQQEQVTVTLEALTLIKQELGVQTVLGVSNVSFGMPERDVLNATFLGAAFGAGLSAPIMNPLSPKMMEIVLAYRVLNNQDLQAQKYIDTFGQRRQTNSQIEIVAPKDDLATLILQGRKSEAPAKAIELLKSQKPLEIVNQIFVPILDEIGARFEAGTLFLPQLMQSAETVKQAFDVLKEDMEKSGNIPETKGKILMATVKGDIHDIGKNIVKMLLENYGYDVIDLGKDVPIEDVVETVRSQEIRLVGLSALMTTTVLNMKETIEAVRAAGLSPKFMVGGAVLNQEYCSFVGADYYAKDAMESVTIANNFFSNKGN